jgi:hypothetical protein
MLPEVHEMFTVSMVNSSTSNLDIENIFENISDPEITD